MPRPKNRAILKTETPEATPSPAPTEAPPLTKVRALGSLTLRGQTYARGAVLNVTPDELAAIAGKVRPEI